MVKHLKIFIWNRTGLIPENKINTILEIFKQDMYQKYGSSEINEPDQSYL